MIYELLHYIAEIVKNLTIKDEDSEQYQMAM